VNTKVTSYDALVEHIVAIANRVHQEMLDSKMTKKRAFAPVMQEIENNDIVYTVWQDASQTHGVGHLIIKGESLLRNLLVDNRKLTVRIGAVPCVCAEQAHALRKVKGEKALH
jgi:hypothetical protein